MTNPVSCAFAPLDIDQFAVTGLVIGRGKVTALPQGNRFKLGQTVMLTAWPEANQSFLGWSGDGAGTQTNLSVFIDRSKTNVANFTRFPHFSEGPCLNDLMKDAFQLSLVGELGAVYEMDSSLDLIHWTFLRSVTNLFGTVQFVDPDVTTGLYRFYRAREP